MRQVCHNRLGPGRYEIGGNARGNPAMVIAFDISMSSERARLRCLTFLEIILTCGVALTARLAVRSIFPRLELADRGQLGQCIDGDALCFYLVTCVAVIVMAASLFT